MSLKVRISKSPAENIAEDLKGTYELKYHGLKNINRAYWNLEMDPLNMEIEFRGEKAYPAKNGGENGLLSANDRFIVREETTCRNIDWGIHYRPFAPCGFSILLQRMAAYLQQRDVFIQEGYTGGDPENRRSVRIISEHAAQSIIAREILVQPEDNRSFARFVPVFTIISVPGFQASPEVDGTASDRFVLINFEQRMALIGNCNNPGEVRELFHSIVNGEFL